MKTIINWVKAKLPYSATEAPKRFCPDCWGRQEYDGVFYEPIKIDKLNTNNIVIKKGWIQGYAIKYLTGLHTNNMNNNFVCKPCSLSYRRM